MAQKGKLTFVSVGSKFKSQLQELLEKLRNNVSCREIVAKFVQL